jgi:hypothetical protein
MLELHKHSLRKNFEKTNWTNRYQLIFVALSLNFPHPASYTRMLLVEIAKNIDYHNRSTQYSILMFHFGLILDRNLLGLINIRKKRYVYSKYYPSALQGITDSKVRL